ncbi:MAG TPA: hypothetical protein VFK02_32675 [Kofleriaceae bacterium]|nr:hypothetical protein [Kofleriaceae bacterium]
MNPRLVWDVWRRILTNEDWVATVLAGDLTRLAPQVSPEERAVLEAYASTPEATRTTIHMFRSRTQSVARSSLGIVAPHTKRLLEKTGEDRATALTKAYTVASGYRDDGPRFCKTALDFLGFLAGVPAFQEAPGWADILALETASVRLQQRLGDDHAWRAPPACDPAFDREAGETLLDYDAWALVWCGNAETARLDHDVTAWLEDPTALGETAVAPGPTWWIASLADAESEVAYAQISERAFDVYALLARPLRPAELGARVPALPEDDVLSILGELLDLGVIRAIRA